MTTMFPLETLATYLAAVLLVIVAPGPDNILASGISNLALGNRR